MTKQESIQHLIEALKLGKLNTVKAIKELTGLGLREAKEFTDNHYVMIGDVDKIANDIFSKFTEEQLKVTKKFKINN